MSLIARVGAILVLFAAMPFAAAHSVQNGSKGCTKTEFWSVHAHPPLSSIVLIPFPIGTLIKTHAFLTGDLLLPPLLLKGMTAHLQVITGGVTRGVAFLAIPRRRSSLPLSVARTGIGIPLSTSACLTLALPRPLLPNPPRVMGEEKGTATTMDMATMDTATTTVEGMVESALTSPALLLYALLVWTLAPFWACIHRTTSALTLQQSSSHVVAASPSEKVKIVQLSQALGT